MDSNTSTEYIKDLNEILKLLEKDNFLQQDLEKQVTALYKKSAEFYSSILKDASWMVRNCTIRFLNYVGCLNDEKVDTNNKIQIVEGLIPFISDFLSKENKTIRIKDYI